MKTIKAIIEGSLVDHHHFEGLDAEIIVTYEYEPAQECPMSGSKWDESLDLPGVRATLSLPCRSMSCSLLQFLEDPEIRVLGEAMGNFWGESAGFVRNCSLVVREKTIAQSLLAARNQVAHELRKIKGIIARRASRLAQREATISASLADSTQMDTDAIGTSDSSSEPDDSCCAR